MFPLGTVLFPHGVLPLHIFEQRYLTMIDEALQDDSEFGVALIERGSEVGGGDQRFEVGTIARIVRAGRIDESRLAIVTVGLQRVQVVEWLEEVPYPRAMVRDRPESDESADLAAEVADAQRSLRRVMALASELGANVGSADITTPDDARQAAWTLCAIAPIEQLDRQRLLEIDDHSERLRQLKVALDDQVTVLQDRLSSG